MKVAGLVLALGTAALATTSAATLGQAPNGSENRRFASDSMPWVAGERLEFRVKFGMFNVGSSVLQVVGLANVRSTPVWHVQFTIRGGALGWDLIDTMQSWFGTEDLVTRRFVHNSDENGRKRHRSVEVFPDRGLYVNQSGDTLATVESPLDDASFFFYARTLPLEVGQTYTIPRYYVRDRNPVQIRVIQKQTINVPAGRFPCIVIQPIFRSRGIFGQGGSALIWLSDDAARIPVKIRGSMSIGTLEMSLRSRR